LEAKSTMDKNSSMKQTEVGEVPVQAQENQPLLPHEDEEQQQALQEIRHRLYGLLVLCVLFSAVAIFCITVPLNLVATAQVGYTDGSGAFKSFGLNFDTYRAKFSGNQPANFSSYYSINYSSSTIVSDCDYLSDILLSVLITTISFLGVSMPLVLIYACAKAPFLAYLNGGIMLLLLTAMSMLVGQWIGQFNDHCIVPMIEQITNYHYSYYSVNTISKTWLIASLSIFAVEFVVTVYAHHLAKKVKNNKPKLPVAAVN